MKKWLGWLLGCIIKSHGITHTIDVQVTANSSNTVTGWWLSGPIYKSYKSNSFDKPDNKDFTIFYNPSQHPAPSAPNIKQPWNFLILFFDFENGDEQGIQLPIDEFITVRIQINHLGKPTIIPSKTVQL